MDAFLLVQILIFALHRLPFWSYGKLFFNCWLVLPYFNGAAHVYEHFVRPVIVNQQVVNIRYIPKRRDSDKPDDVISAAQKYIEQNGSKAFEAMVNKVFSIICSILARGQLFSLVQRELSPICSVVLLSQSLQLVL